MIKDFLILVCVAAIPIGALVVLLLIGFFFAYMDPD